MKARTRPAEAIAQRVPLRYLPREPRATMEPSWRQARPARIQASLAHALQRPGGGWYVVGVRDDVPANRSMVRTVNGAEVTLWRDDLGALHAGPGACPHLGARLDNCQVMQGRIVCDWHGMALGEQTGRLWPTYAAHDDGELLWVRLPGEHADEAPTQQPMTQPRPEGPAAIAAVVVRRGICEPRDIIQNRLDPWHGSWFHPYAFSHLRVDEEASDEATLVLDVAYRVGGPFAVPVRAEFRCPDPRTIVMTIVDGEGAGSVVETHATPLTAPGVAPAITVMTEVTIATSPRPGFGVAVRLSPLIRAGMRRSAAGLWQDDLEYAERLYELRRR